MIAREAGMGLGRVFGYIGEGLVAVRQAPTAVRPEQVRRRPGIFLIIQITIEGGEVRSEISAVCFRQATRRPARVAQVLTFGIGRSLRGHPCIG